MGKIGSNKVYAISDNSFLNSSQMIVIVNKKGDVAAYSGGTTQGAGTVALQTGSTLLSAGAIAYAGKSIEHGLETTHVSANGIPSTFQVNANIKAPQIHTR